MEFLPTSAPEAANLVWLVSLVLGAVVSLVVVLLLWLIHNAAARIDALVANIWDTGQRVANNTVHIPALYKTSAVAGRILQTALRINDGAAAIEAHAKGCRGCPRCLM